MSVKKFHNLNDNPWIFNGIPFIETNPKLTGFVYLIEDTETGKRYIGKKFFWSMRKLPGKTRRTKKESDWKEYYSSNDEIKELAKINKNRFKRTILSLHELKRDVNYTEVKFQYVYGVLEEFNENGESLWYNGNISGKHYSHLVKDIKSRSIYQDLDCKTNLRYN
jgi:hypothetical protein